MTETTRKSPPKTGDRKARLKSALKANMAKRKAQARVRGGDGKAKPVSGDAADQSGD